MDTGNAIRLIRGDLLKYLFIHCQTLGVWYKCRLLYFSIYFFFVSFFVDLGKAKRKAGRLKMSIVCSNWCH